MLWVKLGTHITDHERFLAIGPLARDLWTWGMLYAGKHETDGELPLAAVLTTTWGAGPKANAKLAEVLVGIGLWRKTDRGFAVCRWREQGNETKETLTAKRKAGNERKARSDAKRNGVGNAVTPGVTPRVSNAKGSTSLSSRSLSDLSSGSQIASELPTGVRERIVEPIDPDEMPDWFHGSCDATAMALGGEVTDRPALWVQYLASRRRKTWAMDHTDAVGWLAAVVKSERAKVRASPGTKLVQSAENRAWKMPEGGNF